MRRIVASVVIIFALTLGTAYAQSTESFGGSLATSDFLVPFPMLGMNVIFEDLIAEDVGLRLSLNGIALGGSGLWLFGGTAGAGAVWSLAANDEATVRPYARGWYGHRLRRRKFRGQPRGRVHTPSRGRCRRFHPAR